jgi:serine/threonine-protein kinase RsbW
MRSRRRVCELRATLPATLEAIEGLCAEFRLRNRNGATPGLGFAAELLLREALTNAVVHGSRADPSRQIRCTLRLRPGRLIISVQDDGGGFDWRAAFSRRSGDRETSGRGMEILRAYSSRVRFNARGNSVTIVKRLEPEGGER